VVVRVTVVAVVVVGPAPVVVVVSVVAPVHWSQPPHAPIMESLHFCAWE